MARRNRVGRSAKTLMSGGDDVVRTGKTKLPEPESEDDGDVYTYQDTKSTKRIRNETDIDPEARWSKETQAAGSDSDESDIGDVDLISDPEAADFGDDSDIDSDEAFTDGEEDGLMKRKGIDVNEIDLDEDSSASDNSDEEYIDAAQLFDMDLYDKPTAPAPAASSSSSDSDSDDGDLPQLTSFIEGLGKRKRDTKEDGASRRKHTKLNALERAEALREGEFSAAGGAAVGLDDMLSVLDKGVLNVGHLRKRLGRGDASEAGSIFATPTEAGSSARGTAQGALAAPLPARLQDKIERDAAYQQTKIETDTWNATVKRMKGERRTFDDARHSQLKLPLVAPGGDLGQAPTAAALAASLTPTGELESAVHGLLERSGLGSEREIQRAEATTLAALDPAEAARRLADLRRQRDLLFRAERQAKRVSKIKSKAFRRIQRRKARAGESGESSLAELEELDAVDGGERAAEARARLEVARARERASLKHSARGGRWAREAQRLVGGLDESRDAAVREMAQRAETLRRKIAADSGESDSGESEYDSDALEDVAAVKRRAFDELAALESAVDATGEETGKLKGVMAMKFMQDAVRRGEKSVRGDIDTLRRELEGAGTSGASHRDDYDGDGDGYHSSSSSTAEGPVSQRIGGNAGRMVFNKLGGGDASTQKAVEVQGGHTQTQESDSSDDDLFILGNGGETNQEKGGEKAGAKRGQNTNTGAKRGQGRLSMATSTPDETSNPWLDATADTATTKPKAKASKTTALSAADKSQLKMKAEKSKKAESKRAQADDARVDISAGALLGAGDSDDDSENGEEINFSRGKGKVAIKQRELIAEAFADDDVVTQFAEMKQREIEREAPKEVDTTLPGWGSWGGKGVKKRKNKNQKHVVKVAGVAKEERKDAQFKHVIISEKKDKKASKYMLKDLPFPYTSVAQFENSLRIPRGAEWNTSTIVRDQTRPEIEIAPGAVIRPVDRKM